MTEIPNDCVSLITVNVSPGTAAPGPPDTEASSPPVETVGGVEDGHVGVEVRPGYRADRADLEGEILHRRGRTLEAEVEDRDGVTGRHDDVIPVVVDVVPRPW